MEAFSTDLNFDSLSECIACYVREKKPDTVIMAASWLISTSQTEGYLFQPWNNRDNSAMIILKIFNPTLVNTRPRFLLLMTVNLTN